MTRDQIYKARAMLAQSVPEKFVAGSLDVSAKTLRHCLQLANEFETFVRCMDEAMRQPSETGVKKRPGKKKWPVGGFSDEERRAINEAVAAGKVDRIENGEWPDRNLFNLFPRRR